MIKIIRYREKNNVFSRKIDSKPSAKRITAEEELESLIKDGWSIESSSTAYEVVGVVGSSVSFLDLTVILRKDD